LSMARLVLKRPSGLFDHVAFNPVGNDDRSKELLNRYVSPSRYLLKLVEYFIIYCYHELTQNPLPKPVRVALPLPAKTIRGPSLVETC